MFTPQSQYRVVKTFQSKLSAFNEGEILVFKDTTYSLYDASTAFIFQSHVYGYKTWFLHDDEADDSFDRFAQVV